MCSFCDLLLVNSVTFSIFFCVVACVNTSFIFYAWIISIAWIYHGFLLLLLLLIHKSMDIWSVCTFGRFWSDFSGGSVVQNIFAKAEDVGSVSEPTPVLLPGQSHGQRSLAGYIQSMGCKQVGHDLATKQRQPLWLMMLWTFMHKSVYVLWVESLCNGGCRPWVPSPRAISAL